MSTTWTPTRRPSSKKSAVRSLYLSSLSHLELFHHSLSSISCYPTLSLLYFLALALVLHRNPHCTSPLLLLSVDFPILTSLHFTISSQPIVIALLTFKNFWSLLQSGERRAKARPKPHSLDHQPARRPARMSDKDQLLSFGFPPERVECAPGLSLMICVPVADAALTTDCRGLESHRRTRPTTCIGLLTRERRKASTGRPWLGC